MTLVVADEFNKGYPVGFFISNQADELSLRPFLEEIKKMCPEDLKLNTVMTDDDIVDGTPLQMSLGQRNTICYVSGTILGHGEESCS